MASTMGTGNGIGNDRLAQWAMLQRGRQSTGNNGVWDALQQMADAYLMRTYWDTQNGKPTSPAEQAPTTDLSANSNTTLGDYSLASMAGKKPDPYGGMIGGMGMSQQGSGIGQRLEQSLAEQSPYGKWW